MDYKTYICPNCDYKLQLDEETLAKKYIKCSNCESTLEVHKENGEFKCLYLKKKKFKFTKMSFLNIFIISFIILVLVAFIIIFIMNSDSINNIPTMYK